jgi:hypothetical protein
MIGPLDLVQCLGVVFGIAGAVLVACRSGKVRGAGFASWVVGNLLWVAFGVAEGDVYVTALFAFYWMTAVVGLRNSWRGCEANIEF